VRQSRHDLARWGQAGHGVVRYGMAVVARSGWAWCGQAGLGLVWHRRRGTVSWCWAMSGWVGRGRRG